MRFGAFILIESNGAIFESIIAVLRNRLHDQNMDSIAIKSCFKGRTVRRSLIVALVVGTGLNAINQGDTILAGEMPTLWKVVLTYMVPFFVTTYGAYSAFSSPRVSMSEDHV